MPSTIRVAAAIVLAAGSTASAIDLTTGFAGTTTGATVNGGSFFNVTALDPAGITIDRFEVNSNAAAGTAITVNIYAHHGGYQGSELTAASWAQLGPFAATSAGPGMPTIVGIGGLYIPPGEMYGIRTSHVNGGYRYSSTPISVSDASAQIDSGAIQGGLFTATPIAARGWNGTISYTVGNTTISGACCLPNG